MKEKLFIKKLETENFWLGSFDAYQEEIEKLVLDNRPLLKDAQQVLEKYQGNYSASIISKKSEFVGFIGVRKIEEEHCDFDLEVIPRLTIEEKNEIFSEFKKWLEDYLNIKSIMYNRGIMRDNSQKQVDDDGLEREMCMSFSLKGIDIPREESFSGPRRISESSQIYKREPKIDSKFKYTPSVIETNKKSELNMDYLLNNLKRGIEESVLIEMKKQYEIPKLIYPYTIVYNEQVLGIIGLTTEAIWSNRKANLNIYVNKCVDASSKLLSTIINKYLKFLHYYRNISSISYNVDASDKKMLELISSTNMDFYAEIPYSIKNDYGIGSKFLFESYQVDMEKKGIIPENKIIDASILETDKKELSNEITLDDNFRLTSPKILATLKEKDKIILQFAKSMEEREKITIPLGEDKYIPQVGNGKYGLSKKLMNFSYVLLDKNNNYCGFINIIKDDKENKNAEIEIAIKTELQNKGLGTKVLSTFYNELFSLGYASATSTVFEFNKASLRMHEKLADFNGIRTEAYYIKRKYWNIHYYTKINPIINS